MHKPGLFLSLQRKKYLNNNSSLWDILSQSYIHLRCASQETQSGRQGIGIKYLPESHTQGQEVSPTSLSSNFTSNSCPTHPLRIKYVVGTQKKKKEKILKRVKNLRHTGLFQTPVDVDVKFNFPNTFRELLPESKALLMVPPNLQDIRRQPWSSPQELSFEHGSRKNREAYI